MLNGLTARIKLRFLHSTIISKNNEKVNIYYVYLISYDYKSKFIKCTFIMYIMCIANIYYIHKTSNYTLQVPQIWLVFDFNFQCLQVCLCAFFYMKYEWLGFNSYLWLKISKKSKLLPRQGPVLRFLEFWVDWYHNSRQRPGEVGAGDRQPDRPASSRREAPDIKQVFLLRLTVSV